MSDDAQMANGLLLAIDEFRAEVLTRIDAALAGLRERERQEIPAMERSSAPARLTGSEMKRDARPESLGGRPGGSLRGAEPEPIARRETSADSAAIDTRESVGSHSSEPAVAGASADIGGASPAQSSDSHSRLDALARLLDQRLNVTRADRTESPGRGDQGVLAQGDDADKPGGTEP